MSLMLREYTSACSTCLCRDMAESVHLAMLVTGRRWMALLQQLCAWLCMRVEKSAYCGLPSADSSAHGYRRKCGGVPYESLSRFSTKLEQDPSVPGDCHHSNHTFHMVAGCRAKCDFLNSASHVVPPARMLLRMSGVSRLQVPI